MRIDTKMISIYGLIKTKNKTTHTGEWRLGTEKEIPPDMCTVTSTRNGDVETHYWVVKGTLGVGLTCLCGKERYRK